MTFFRALWLLPRVIVRIVPPPTPSVDWQSILALLAPFSLAPAIADAQNTNPVTAISSAKNEADQKGEVKTDHSQKQVLWESLKLPFSTFTVVWCLMIALTTK